MKKIFFLITLYLFVFSLTTFSQNQPLPFDKDVITGTLDNGVKYYIKKNQKPEKRAELRLYVKAGSVLENEDQRGLAHFVEHMAFNGTKHFKKNELINYLEKLGIKFGPELNAYTSFDQTVYMLTVPTDSINILKTGFLVLEDWAHNLSFDTTEINKERGVVIEEWRLGRGANMRMLDKQLPILFKGSRYAERLPIGKKEIIESANYETIKDFYKDWYRPDLIAVAAVGDFDVNEIENYIKQHFSNLHSPENERERKVYDIPGHEDTYFAIASDKEATYSTVSLYYLQKPREVRDLAGYKNQLIHDIFYGILNDRLNELTTSSNPPFSYAFAGDSRFAKSSDISFLTAMVKDGGIETGFEALLREAERVKEFGFTSTELERQKTNYLRMAEKRLAEKDKTESSQIIREFDNNFLYGDPIISIEDQYKLAQELIPEITLDEVNTVSSELLKHENRVVMVNSPEKENLKIPTEEELSAIIAKVGSEKITPYEDKVAEKPLIETVPSPSPVVSSKNIERLGLIEWRLKNGVKVFLKPTDFKNDEIVFSAFSPGGSSLVKDEDFLSAQNSPALVRESGLDGFNKTELDKYLSGKIVNVSPYMGFYYEGLNGSASPKDAETLFQLIYSYFTSPRIDSTGFLSLKSKMKSYLENKSNNPQSAFSDTLTVTLTDYHFRSRPLTVKMLDEINPNKSLNIFKERFRDAGDFTFVFVGNIDTTVFKPLVETYLGGLPSFNSNEKPVDLKYHNITGTIEKEVDKGIEPKSSVAIVYVGDMNWSRKEEHTMESLVDVLDIKLREVLREDKGGTYGVYAYDQIYRIPTAHYSINFGFGCNPDRVDELVQAFYSVLDSIKTFGPDDVVMTKIKETQKRQRELNLKQNKFWNNEISDYLENNDDPMQILNYNQWVDELTADDIKNAADKYLGKNVVKVVLYPESEK
ncbi:MAG: insulinase family protein [Ignavibacteriaceae bacterium]|jgi:zinc protease|nr:insulinase family protein [Ignavibacteriaceae bacterium]MCW8996899.1 insulinase family protein [Psychromonas sp.]MCW9096115.1 insulinase family protein [Ignavibacteriaceae bacterium]